MASLPPLPRRPLGNTGLQVSVLGYGASPLGGVFSDGGIDEERAIAAVHRAFQLGVNFFDTSPFYGGTKSETVLGKALKGLPRDQIVLATKVGRYGPDFQDFDFSAARVTASVQESLARLQTSYIDLIQTHDIEFGSLDQIINETLPALLKLKEQGVVRHVGITGLPLKIYPYVLDRSPPGSVEAILSYCHCTLADTSLLGLVPYLRAKGLGVVNASVLCMGLFTPQGGPSWHPAPPELKTLAGKVTQYAQEQGMDIVKLSFLHSLSSPDIATHLVGMVTPEEVEGNVRMVLQALGVLDDPQGEEERRVLGEVLAMLQPVHNVTWPSGHPENN